METKYSWHTFCGWCFAFACFSFLAVHYAHMKTPVQDRYVASSKEVPKPMYDASFKY